MICLLRYIKDIFPDVISRSATKNKRLSKLNAFWFKKIEFLVSDKFSLYIRHIVIMLIQSLFSVQRRKGSNEKVRLIRGN